MVIASFNHFPVHDLPKGGEVGSAAVLVVEIVGVLPDVEGEQGFEAFREGVAGVGFLGDDQGAVFLCGEPHPAAAEEGDAFGLELGFEGIEVTPLLLDLSCLITRRLLGHLVGGLKLGEVEVVVEDLAGIVEDAALGFFHDLFQRHRLERRAGNEFVEVVHVALEVLAVVEFEGLGADHRRQGVLGVRKID